MSDRRRETPSDFNRRAFLAGLTAASAAAGGAMVASPRRAVAMPEPPEQAQARLFRQLDCPAIELPGEIGYLGKAAGGCGISLPPGVYRITETLELPHGFTLEGAGANSTVLWHDVPDGPCIAIRGEHNDAMPKSSLKKRFVRVRGLTIAGSRGYPPAGPAIEMTDAEDNHLSDLHITGVRRGVHVFSYSRANRFTNVKIDLYVHDEQAECMRIEESEANLILGCRFGGEMDRRGRGLVVKGAHSGPTIIGCRFGSADIGIETSGLVLGMSISGCHFQTQDVAVLVGEEPEPAGHTFGLTMTGNYVFSRWEGTTRDPRAVVLDRCKGAFVGGNQFFRMGTEGESPEGHAMEVTDNARDVAFVGNGYTGGWKKALPDQAPESVQPYYGELMNGAPDQGFRTPFRITGKQFGFADIPVLSDNPSPPDDSYARLFAGPDKNGEQRLWVFLNGTAYSIAKAGELPPDAPRPR